MTDFRVQVMTSKDYAAMMCGSHEYTVDTYWFFANSKEEALEIAKSFFPEPKYVINDTIYSEEEIEEAEKRDLEIKHKILEEETRKKALKELREIENAKKLNMTVEEYRTYKNRLAKARKYKKEIAELQTQIAEKESYIQAIEKKYGEVI